MKRRDNEAGILAERKATEKSTLVKKMVTRFSRGNVKLQRGCYLTQKDQDARKKALEEYDFMS